MTFPAHPYADLFPLMHADERAALATDIKANGLHCPIVLFHGQILDGRNRLAACELAGIRPVYQTFDGSDDEALALALSLNLARRHLTTGQRATLAVRLLPVEQKAARLRMLAGSSTHPTQHLAEGVPKTGEATARAGARVGLSKETIRKAAKIATNAPDVFAGMEAGTVRTIGEALKLARLDVERRSQVLGRMRLAGARLRDIDGEAATPIWYRSAGEVEWWTPPKVLDAARHILNGEIDLDPASCAGANATVNAKRYFDIEADGLKHQWMAKRLWLNPPYGTVGPRGGKSRQGVWVKKLVTEFDEGRTKQAVLLVRAAPCNAWFQPLWRFPIAFLRQRLEFVPGPGVTGQPVAHSALVGIGVDDARFVEAFKPWGQVILPAASGVGYIGV